MKQIKLHGKYGKGKYALVDNEDFLVLSQFKWHLLKIGYPAYREKGRRIDPRKYICMHSKIMNTPIGMQTDHINMDKLDNRRDNLRVCTKAENMRNTKIRKGNKSGYKGVSFYKDKWIGHITKDYNCYHLGYFFTKEEAAQAYNRKASELFGAFAQLNNI